MLDPDEVAAYEAWKHEKLLGTVDLSVRAYNAEMVGHAAAYERAIKDAMEVLPPISDISEKLSALSAKNPYRARGMRGAAPSISTTRITSESQ